MRKWTVAEYRAKYLGILAKRSASYEADPAGTIARANKTMNSFYRLAGYSERLFYINNDERLYNCYRRRLEAMEAREENWIKRVSGYLEEFNADIQFNGIYPSVIDRQRTEHGGIFDLGLTCWY